MGWLVYQFEAKAIQSYILAGGRLRHVVGGSRLVDGLTATDQIDRLLDRCDLRDVAFTRRAGGVFTFAVPASAAARAALDRFRLAWTFHVRRAVPGLAFAEAAADAATVVAALDQVRRAATAGRAVAAPELPAASPLMLRAPRTGAAAVGRAAGGEILDRGLAAKEEAAKERAATGDLDTAFLPVDALVPAKTWPLNMEADFPFPGEDRTIAVFHADGNRMGEIVQALGAHLTGEVAAGRLDERGMIDRLRAFSDATDQATRWAAGEAGRVIAAAGAGTAPPRHGRADCHPARPIVLAGDDLTVILRADLALAFARRFLAAFPEGVERCIRPLLAGMSDPPRLTACGGLVYGGADQPFVQLLDLAEGLCKHAKSRAKALVAGDNRLPVPTTLAFHRLTVSHIADYADVLAHDLTSQEGNARLLTAQPYRITTCHDQAGIGGGGLANLDDLVALADALSGEGLAAGFRGLAADLYRAPARARAAFDRLAEVARAAPASDWGVVAAALARLCAALSTAKETGGDGADDPPLFAGGRTPILDAVALAEITRHAGPAPAVGQDAA